MLRHKMVTAITFGFRALVWSSVMWRYAFPTTSIAVLSRLSPWAIAFSSSVSVTAFMCSSIQDLGGAGCAANGGYADVVAVRQFLERSALCAPSGGLFLLRGVETRRP